MLGDWTYRCRREILLQHLRAFPMMMALRFCTSYLTGFLAKLCPAHFLAVARDLFSRSEATYSTGNMFWNFLYFLQDTKVKMWPIAQFISAVYHRLYYTITYANSCARDGLSLSDGECNWLVIWWGTTLS